MIDTNRLSMLFKGFPFNHLSQESREDLQSRVTLNTFKPGEHIYAEGETPSDVHCVLKGKVRILGPAEVNFPTIHIVEEGGVFGWDSVLRRKGTGSARAAGLGTEILTFSITADDFEALVLQELSIALTYSTSTLELFDILYRFIERIPTRKDLPELNKAANFIELHDLAFVRHWFPKNGAIESLPPTYLWFVSGGSPVSGIFGEPIKKLDQLVPLKDSPMPVRLVGIDRAFLAYLLGTKSLPPNASPGIMNNPDGESILTLLEGLSPPEKPQSDNSDGKRKTSYPVRQTLSSEHSEYVIHCLWMAADHLKVPIKTDPLRQWFAKQKKLPKQPLFIYGKLAEAIGMHGTITNFLATSGGLNRLETPAMLFVDGVPCILYEATQNNVVIGSPTNGLMNVSPHGIVGQLHKTIGKNRASFSQALILKRQLKSGVKKFGWGWFVPHLKPQRGILIQVFIASVFVQLLGLANPLLTQQIIDKVIINASANALPMYAVLLLSFTVLEGILTISRAYLLNSATNWLDLYLGAEIVRHLLNLPMGFFQKRPVGELAARIGELENIRQFLTGTFITAFLDVLFSIIYVFVMALYSVKLTFCVLGLIPLILGLIAITAPIIQKHIRIKSDQNSKMQSYLIAVLNGMFTVKSQSMEPLIEATWRIQYLNYLDTGFRTTMIATATQSANNLINNTSSLLVLWVGGAEVLNGNLSLGELIAFRIISGYVTSPLIRLSKLWERFQTTKLSMELLADIIDSKPEYSLDEEILNLELPQIKGEIRYENVSFSFQGNDQLQLSNASFSIPTGAFVGLVGMSGSGKSTLLKLLPRFHDPAEGEIYIDGYDISKASLNSLRSQMGIVPQDPVLFEGTVRENIGNFQEVADDVIREAARLAEADEFIMSMDKGYGARIEERGSNLSGGQRQRIALARMIVKNPNLIILDEATSALDYETERKVCENLRQRFRGRTVFFITHRLANLVKANKILFMQSGLIVEEGSHAQLMASRKLYYSLFTQQVQN
jgi:ATP-binding cassette, subfamily B, bacterial HlyB/CyaB